MTSAHAATFRCLCRAGLLATLAGSAAWAQTDLSPLTATRSVTWSSGAVAEQFSYCVESFQEAPDKKSSTPIPYAVAASIGGATTPFSLANAAGQTLPASLEWTDMVTATTFTLAPAVATSTTLTGRLAACPGGNNGRLTIRVSSTALAAALPGTYSRTFTVEVSNLGSGRARRSGTVTLGITIPTVVRISNINNIVLGAFDGINDLVNFDDVCIYKNVGTTYSITATGNGAGGAFTLSNGSGVAPYTVTWQDNAGSVQLATGVRATNRGNASTSGDCNGGTANNARFTVRMTAPSLRTVQPGAYTGVLTLRLEPL